jgi:hypothetical protein
LRDLAIAIANKIVEHVRAQVSSLANQDAEYRGVFNGPPVEVLELVLEELAKGSGIDASLTGGQAISIPVVLQVPELPVGEKNPPIGASGICDLHHLLDLRNARNCKQFIALVPPSRLANISQTSTRTDFGLSAHNNSGSANLEQWWSDEFVQGLVDDALAKFGISEAQAEEARRLLEHAARAANAADVHDGMRRNAWRLLARLWEALRLEYMPAAARISLVCGFPPNETNQLDAYSQARVLDVLAGRMEGGFRSAINHLKAQAPSTAEQAALDAVLSQVQQRCEIATALSSGMAHYYLPVKHSALEAVPGWWTVLTVEKWSTLFDEQGEIEGELEIRCTNSVESQGRGLVPFTRGEIALTIRLPDEVQDGLAVTVTRNPKVAATRKEWTWIADGTREFAITDDQIPEHKTPLVYTAVAAGLKSSSTKVISLAGWAPGFIACSPTASKTSAPKPILKSKFPAFELSMILDGEGRHYIDLFTREGVTPAFAAYVGDDDAAQGNTEESPIHKVEKGEYGLEVLGADGRTYQFEIERPDGTNAQVQLHLACDEVDTETCPSEFDRLIRLNRREGKRAAGEVHVNRQQRCTDLQSWMLDETNAAESFYPVVLAPDYATKWRKCDWKTENSTVFSQGKFVHDPRPPFGELVPPAGFKELRQKIAKRVRGSDGDGLVESAKLGEWTATDPEFASDIQDYVRLYLDWLAINPAAAAWCDIVIACQIEPDGATLSQEPDAAIVSPLHPVRLAWHCLAQRAMFNSQKKAPCPAASVLDPDCVPDVLALPLMTPSGNVKERIFLATECSSDYWSVLWNGTRLGQLSTQSGQAPFHHEFGLVLGGISSGFSVSQVHRALNDLSDMLVAKPVLNILVSSASGQNNACNEGVISWCRKSFSNLDSGPADALSLGPRMANVLDERTDEARPADAEIANLSEDTNNAVRWYAGASQEMTPDLGIIAQLELSNVDCVAANFGSPMAYGGLIRSRLREQWKVSMGVVLCESRMGILPPSGSDPLADRLVMAIAHLENIPSAKYAYQFAPSPHAIESVLDKADFAAVSSSTVDPACFLGRWLDNSFLWDYALPSYSNRADDTNGYYLLSRIKEADCDALGQVLRRLPGCDTIPAPQLDELLLEISRRGIPTVRGMSNGDTGASGDLGMFVASRLLQDEFRLQPIGGSLLPVRTGSKGGEQIVFLVPVDPFKGYLEDMARALKASTIQRPDLLVIAIEYASNSVRCKLTPVEVKFRGTSELGNGAPAALQQAKALAKLLNEISAKANEPSLEMWKIGFQHLMASFINFAFRVYSQQAGIASAQQQWSQLHSRLLQSVFAGEAEVSIDQRGRLVVVDNSNSSGYHDHDVDGFPETMVISRADAATIVQGNPVGIYANIKDKLGTWDLLPSGPQMPGIVPIVAKTCPASTLAPIAAEAPATGAWESQSGKIPVGEQQTIPSPVVPVDEILPTAPPANMAIEGVESSTAGGVLVRVGNTADTFQPQARILDLSNTALNQMNIGVVGDLGTGKTQLLKSLVAQIACAKEANKGVTPNVLIFDYKKDYSSDEFVKAVGAKVVKPEHLPVNLFSLANAQSSVAPWLSRYKFFADVLEKIYPNVGPVQLGNLRDAVKKSYADAAESGGEPTIYDVAANYEALVPKKDSVSSILTDMVDMELFSPNPGHGQGFDQFLDGVVVLSLNLLGQDDRTKNMLVAIMLNMFYERMLKVPKRPYYGNAPQRRVIDSFLLVDEADNIMKYQFDVLRKLLLEGREFGMGVILASQYLSHFKVGASDYREPLLTWFIHKVPNVTPTELSTLGMEGTLASLAERVKSLKLHECLYKTHNISGEVIKGFPFFAWAEWK